jgi:hypothetical protein
VGVVRGGEVGEGWRKKGGVVYLTDVTSQLRATAARQIREPRKPLPPKTTILFVADMVGLFYVWVLMSSWSDACELSLRLLDAEVFRPLILIEEKWSNR